MVWCKQSCRRRFGTLQTDNRGSPETLILLNTRSRASFFFVRDGRRNYVQLEEEIKAGKTLDKVRNEMRKQMPFELRGFVEVFSEYENRIEIANGSSSATGIPRTKVHFEITNKTKLAIQWAIVKLKEILEEAGCKDPYDLSLIHI